MTTTIRNGQVSELGKYGCHNRPPLNSIVWHSQPKLKPLDNGTVWASAPSWPHAMSTDCRYDRSHDDERCAACMHARVAA